MGLSKVSLKNGITTAVSIFIAVIGLAIAIGRWQEGVEQRLSALEEKVTPMEERIASQDVRYAAIQTDLAWIKATLIRIEEDQEETPGALNQGG